MQPKTAESVIHGIVNQRVREWCLKHGYSKKGAKRRANAVVNREVAKRVERRIMDDDLRGGENEPMGFDR